MANISLRQLRYLSAVAEHLHFGNAAKACHVSQPSLSAQIAQLEQELGVALFERGNRRVLLTAAGQDAAVRARRILQEVQDLADAAGQGAEPLSGPLKLGVIPTIGPYLMPRILPALRQAYPKLRLFLREDLTDNLLVRLRAGELDVLLLALPLDESGLEMLPLFDDAFCVALPHGHPLADKAALTESDLNGQDLLLLEDGHCFRDQALAVCRRAGGATHHEFVGTSLESLRHMVAGGAGITLLPDMACQEVMPGLVLRQFVAPIPTRHIGLAWRRGASVARDAQLLGGVLARVAADGV
jgi:LysR family transcriptional regulator, hydrogen peroxide-inducible genes activator